MFVATLWIAVFVVACLQIFYGYVFFRHAWRISQKRSGSGLESSGPQSALPPVSVIICAHNEADNLRAYLPEVLNQDYYHPDGSLAFEVIVVNDGSTDDTEKVLAEMAEQYIQLKAVHVPKDAPRSFPGKKFPLSKGLDAARYGLILCTDADCAPASDAWLRLMAKGLRDAKEIVAGYGGYRRTGTALNTFIRYETLHTFLQYHSFTKAGVPYMAVGRNLAATREVFLKAQQHPAWSKLPSGDDDLLVQLCADGRNMTVLADPASFTWSAAKERLDDYLAQKRRHVSTGKFYSLRSKLATGIYALLQAFWWLLAILFVISGMPAVAWIVLLLPFINHVITLRQGAAAMEERTSIAGWFGFFFCWMLYNAVLAPYILWKSKQRWK